MSYIVSFDEWKDEFGITCSKYSVEHYTIESAFKAGAQSRQAEIDELRKLQSMNVNTINEQGRRIDELQNRIDRALEALEDGSLNYCHQILKGK